LIKNIIDIKIKAGKTIQVKMTSDKTISLNIIYESIDSVRKCCQTDLAQNTKGKVQTILQQLPYKSILSMTK
jgi:hypothetical protein